MVSATRSEGRARRIHLSRVIDAPRSMNRAQPSAVPAGGPDRLTPKRALCGRDGELDAW